MARQGLIEFVGLDKIMKVYIEIELDEDEAISAIRKAEKNMIWHRDNSQAERSSAGAWANIIHVAQSSDLIDK